MSDSGITILLAEDNPGDVFLIQRALDEEHLSYGLLVAKDGEEAIHYLSEAAMGKHRIDLVMLDLNLPRRDGLEVLNKLRHCPVLARVPAILLTSSKSPSDRARCLEMGADCFFNKPSSLASFMHVGKLAREVLESALKY